MDTQKAVEKQDCEHVYVTKSYEDWNAVCKLCGYDPEMEGIVMRKEK